MAEELSFAELLDRVREGDSQAVGELLCRYESHLRRVIRIRLTDPLLQREFDSIDVYQSMVADFLKGISDGKIKLRSPGELVNLLKEMAEHTLCNKVARARAKRRDVRRLEKGGIDHIPLSGREETPSQIVANKEPSPADQKLLAQVRDRLLSDEERYLAEQWAKGRPWAELAAELGCKEDALRIRFRRALDRVKKELF